MNKVDLTSHYLSDKTEYYTNNKSKFKNKSKISDILNNHKEIIKEIKTTKDLKLLKEIKELSDKIKYISKEKLDYYQSTRFGFIKKFFSSLRNVWKMGTFTSSGQVGLDLSANISVSILQRIREIASDPNNNLCLWAAKQGIDMMPLVAEIAPEEFKAAVTMQNHKGRTPIHLVATIMVMELIAKLAPDAFKAALIVPD